MTHIRVERLVSLYFVDRDVAQCTVVLACSCLSLVVVHIYRNNDFNMNY